MKPTDVRELVSKCSRVLRQMSSSNRHVNVCFCVGEDVAEMIITDGTLLWDIMVNFLSNACKFTTEGTIHLSVSKSDQHGKPPTLLLTVTDTGKGIPEEKRGDLFKPFAQLQSNAGGSGLGLASVAMQTKALGGSCGVSSNEPNGSKFWAQVPYIPAMSAVPTHAKTLSASHMKGLSVLLIEDTHVVRRLATTLLTKVGAVVYQAENGVEGLAMMKESEFSIVLSDMMMPVMDGLECICEFRCWEAQHRPDRHQTICLLTAQASTSIRAQAEEIGVDHVMPKPINVPMVSQLISASS